MTLPCPLHFLGRLRVTSLSLTICKDHYSAPRSDSRAECVAGLPGHGPATPPSCTKPACLRFLSLSKQTPCKTLSVLQNTLAPAQLPLLTRLGVGKVMDVPLLHWRRGWTTAGPRDSLCPGGSGNSQAFCRLEGAIRDAQRGRHSKLRFQGKGCCLRLESSGSMVLPLGDNALASGCGLSLVLSRCVLAVFL